jgi:23S rRNA maturation-related 3'-5' exoribonuclease YhaM
LNTHYPKLHEKIISKEVSDSLKLIMKQEEDAYQQQKVKAVKGHDD